MTRLFDPFDRAIAPHDARLPCADGCCGCRGCASGRRRPGIRLVIAESFERIYRQNADNIGLFTSTDLGLLPRIEAGEAISIKELVAGRDPLAAAILRAGGLLRFGASALAGVGAAKPRAARAAGPRTLFQKIIDRHLRPTSTDERATLTNMTAELGGFTGLVEPDAETLRFLRERRGVGCAHRALEPWMASDPGATYADHLRIDCSRLAPMVARPGAAA